MRALVVSVLVVAIAATQGRVAGETTAGPLDVRVETGTRPAPDGTRISYALYLPQRSGTLPGPPWPVVILTHGFFRDFSRMTLPAVYLAQRGAIVLAPDLPSLLAGEPGQRAAIALTKSHVTWLLARHGTRGDALYRQVDRTRVGLAGHSAGGAVSLEAAWELQDTQTPVAALALLDAVPWPRTIERAATLRSTAVVSLRAAPSACNAVGAASTLAGALPFRAYDVSIDGATHCDAEGPTDGVCALFCGGTSASGRELFQELTASFFHATFGRFPAGTETFDDRLRRLEAAGRIEVVQTP